MANVTLSQDELARRTGAVFLGNYPSGSQEWLDLRKSGIGGSEVAVICGFSKWTSPYTLWAQKTGKIAGEISVNESMEWGTRLESVIIDKFEESHPELKIHRNVGTWRHPEREFQVTNPDAIYEREDGTLGIVEIKTAMYEDDWKDDVPKYYKTQVQWYMQTFGLKHAYVVCLFHGNKYREYELEANDFEQEVAVHMVTRFIDYIKEDKAPDFDGANSTLETLRALHPEIDPELEVELGDLGNEYFRALANLDVAQEVANLKKVEVLAKMGKARRGLINGIPMVSRQARGAGTPFLVNK